MRWLPSIFALALVACACSPSHGGQPFGEFPQEPIANVAVLPWGNRVSFGKTVEAKHYTEVLTKLDRLAGGNLPGVSFELYRYPLMAAGGAHSFRAPSLKLIVLSWWTNTNGWTFGDAEWEISHYIAGTDDNGRPLR